ncbi:MAG TPA: Ku protein [Rhodanobacteraceae bacterium]|nr:Ku protein [Rhodanobacteraceae bacterium]
MPRPIWSGTITFGLLNIPVQLMPGERHTDLHFRMLDSRNNARIRYERINEETGDEVPWKEVVKAFEYDKGNYVVLDKEDFAKAAPESNESVDIEAFVDPDAIGQEFFEKPYYLVPAKKAEKGYVLLRETLKRLKTAGLARVVIRTREYLALVMPRDDALLLMLLRYPQEIVGDDEYAFPDKKLSAYRVSQKELDMAEALVKSMISEWKPDAYHDDFRARLGKVIESRIKAKGGVRAPAVEEAAMPRNASTNVVDFMALLQKSIDDNRRTPAKKKSGSGARRSSHRSGARRKTSTGKKARKQS